MGDMLSQLDTNSVILCTTPPLRYPTQCQDASTYVTLARFLEEKGNKVCGKCGGRLMVDYEDSLWGMPLLRCENPICDYVERLSDYNHILFPNMK